MTKSRASCLIGWPAAHSRSPLIHHHWLRQLGIEGGYNIEAVPPEGFAEFVQRLSAHGFVGANVTIPHKVRALALTMPDARARAVGAANTLWYEGSELRSTNTDIEGFINNLDASAKGWDNIDDALVLGAGGSSRAVVYGLIERGIKRVHLVNRTIERARALADQFRPAVHSAAWEKLGELLPHAGLLVNTTSLGMHGQPALDLDVGLLPPNAIVADLVYVPLETELLKAARARGLKTADGLGMLLHQAVRGFELWFGQRPEVTAELRALVEADLRGA
ncbi:shikimate dehydrogenase [Bradyrhizobium sp.]|uniref:shikimate dehydrogenase n=1 Tax=Bradyrhizobium sp. TaxID=376 RepID=UPI003C3B6A08